MHLPGGSLSYADKYHVQGPFFHIDVHAALICSFNQRSTQEVHDRDGVTIRASWMNHDSTAIVSHRVTYGYILHRCWEEDVDATGQRGTVVARGIVKGKGHIVTTRLLV